ncbi:claudin-4-like [Colossoma macropomum]|uniref:claudin-4-like n=1 Tax=Colossoma macropomum TaxID=42526 RepID=UPI0018655570|nr:claudin-4-like [Colossoma macropomum]
MSRGKEIVSIALVLIGWITAVVACVLPMWKVSAVTEAGTGRAQTIWEGLWMSCVTKSAEKMQCTAYNSTQAITSDLQAARDMTAIAIITALLPLTLSFMGAKCTNCIKDKALQAKVMIISGVFFIIAGCLVIIPASWIKNSIVQEKTPRGSYNPSENTAERSELGAALYTGFAAAALLIIGGVLQCCTCLTRERNTGLGLEHERREANHAQPVHTVQEAQGS